MTLTAEDRALIGEVKARYFRLLDTRQWEAIRDIFTDDARVEGMPPEWGTLERPEAWIERARLHFGEGVVSVHHGHMPELVSTGTDTARGIWAMEDYVTWPRGDRDYRGVRNPEQWGIKGYGHYEDEFRRENGSWRISLLRLTRLRIDALVGPENADPGFTMQQVSADWLTPPQK